MKDFSILAKTNVKLSRTRVGRYHRANPFGNNIHDRWFIKYHVNFFCCCIVVVVCTVSVFVVVASFIVVFCVLCFCLNVWVIRVMCVTCLLCPIVVLLSPGQNPIAIK
jgi:Flp pilus assembly protein TadB